MEMGYLSLHSVPFVILGKGWCFLDKGGWKEAAEFVLTAWLFICTPSPPLSFSWGGGRVRDGAVLHLHGQAPTPFELIHTSAPDP